jgi:16S rRNA (guanine527-N7)-methyltransferase
MGGELARQSQSRWSEELELLATRICPYRLTISPSQWEQLARYCTELHEWNRRYALLSRGDTEEVVRKHISACLGTALLVVPDAATKWVDVGAGAGLPGVVVKIWAPKQPITLIEGSRKKCVFLEHVRQALKLESLSIVAKRVETLIAGGVYLGEFDVLFARAVADIRDTLSEFGPLVRPGGRVLTFKGPGWEEDAGVARSAGILDGSEYRLEEVLRVPWGPGHILAIRKTST